MIQYMYSQKGGYAAVTTAEVAMFEKAGFVKIDDPLTHAGKAPPPVDSPEAPAEAPKRRGRPPKAD